MPRHNGERDFDQGTRVAFDHYYKNVLDLNKLCLQLSEEAHAMHARIVRVDEDVSVKGKSPGDTLALSAGDLAALGARITEKIGRLNALQHVLYELIDEGKGSI